MGSCQLPRQQPATPLEVEVNSVSTACRGRAARRIVMAAHSLMVRTARPTPAASLAPVVGLCFGGLGADWGAPLDRILGGALRRGAGAPKGGAAPPAVEEAAAPVGAAMPSSSIACAAGFGAEAGCWSAGELRGLRGL